VTERHIFVVQSNALHDREAEFNEWYSGTHLAEILKVPGMATAERFVLSPHQRRRTDALPPRFKYLTIYELDGDPRATLDALEAPNARVPGLAIARPLSADLYTSITEKVRRPVR
jgi:hypothetical protein